MKNKTIKTVIIDDDKDDIKLLQIYADKFVSNLSVVSTATNLAEGVATIKNSQPDLVFLDINL